MEDPFATKKDSFSSRLGFILATSGSAIGLANIWKFPYIAGLFGGGSFVLTYLLFLLLVGIPAFFSEILIGKTTQKEPSLAFAELGKTTIWRKIGTATIWTGFLVSSFYSVVAGWVVGYLVEAIRGTVTTLHTIQEAHEHYITLMQNPMWTIGFHGVFMAVCLWFLVGGIRRGIELCNRIFMPLFFVLLIILTSYAIGLPDADKVLHFLTSGTSSTLSSSAFLTALGHAFFTLSIGQGTLVTYGSYLKEGQGFISGCLWIVLADTAVSLFAAFCILSIVFSSNMEMAFGPGLIFQTLPSIFSNISYGQPLAIIFFFLVFIAALTSQVSALEPMIAHLNIRRGMTRRRATYIVVGSSFLLGIPSALPAHYLQGFDFLELMNLTTTAILIPLGGLAAVLLIGYRWGIGHAMERLHTASKPLRYFLLLTIKYTAPFFIIIVLLHSLGIFN